MNYSNLIRNSFYCGIVLYAINTLAQLVLPFLLFPFCLYLPGFIYAIIVVSHIKDAPHKYAFIMLSGLLFISSAYAAMVYSIGKEFSFLIVSPIAMALYFLLYYTVIDTKLHFFKGLFYILLFGVISSILPSMFHIIEKPKPLPFYLVITIFPLWQTLFAVALKLSAKPNNQNIINPSSVTAA